MERRLYTSSTTALRIGSPDREVSLDEALQAVVLVPYIGGVLLTVRGCGVGAAIGGVFGATWRA